MVVVVLSGECPLRPLASCHLKLLRSQLLPPLGVRFPNLLHLYDSFSLAGGVELDDPNRLGLMLPGCKDRTTGREAAHKAQKRAAAALETAAHFESPFTSSGNSLRRCF